MKLQKTNFQIRLKRGLLANINAAVTKFIALEGEPHYTTDTKKLYIFDGSNNQRVHGLDLAVTFGNEVICYNEETVWLT